MDLVKNNKAQSGLAVITLGAVLLIAVLAGVFLVTIPQPVGTSHYSLERFENYDALVAAFQKGQSYSEGMYRDSAIGIMPSLMNSVGSAKATSSSESTDSGATATDYSATNIQVEGVDEADIIKNDGKYVYAIAGGKLYIVNAYPAENAKIISTIDLNELSPQEIFISQNSDKLMLFANNGYNYQYYYSSSSTQNSTVKTASFSAKVIPWQGHNGTRVLIYNISDKQNPVLEKQIDFEGTYLNSRLIGNNAYFVINSYPHYGYYETQKTTDENNIIPLMRIDGVEQRISTATEIGIMPRVRMQSFVTIGSINLQNLEFSKETVAGSANNLYSSQNNLYLAEQQWDYADYNGPIPLEVGMLAKSIYFPNIGVTEKTVITKFSLENGKVNFAGQGTAPGHILNQFSMDEYNSNFRIATTVGEVWNEVNQSRNNLYVFNEDMNMVGTLEGLAPGEKIYSVRFMSERAYMVTFKKVDPLFVIDLANPADPKVLGKLKIPGYSDYLHPIDSTHIIGIGKEAIESTYGTFAWYQGMKMAIFDVSDVANPKEMHKIVIGDRGTDSEALRDHKAFLYDKEKNLLVIPITLAEILNKETINPANEINSPTYGEQTFQGAMVYDVTLTDGFKERGRITHVSAEEELKRGYYYGNDSQILRSLFMDDVLYTFSNKMLKANNLTTLIGISEVIFPQVQNNYYYPGEPVPI